MPSLSEVITELIEKHGGVKSKISRKLGLKPNGKPIYSPQKLGHYATGKYLPKAPFFKAWKEKIGDDRAFVAPVGDKVAGLVMVDALAGDALGFHLALEFVYIALAFGAQALQLFVAHRIHF